MLAILVASLFACQDPQPTPPGNEVGKARPASAVDAKPRIVEDWPDKKARAKIRAFDKLLKNTKKKASMAVRSSALDELTGGRNKHLIKPLARIVRTDKSVVIRKRAVTLIGDQNPDDANGAIRSLLKNSRVTSNPQVHAGLISALSRCGYTSQHWSEIDDVFESDYDPERICVHEAVLELVTTHEEQQALKLLLRNLDEPVPENVDDAMNPPAEYWKARWQSWAVWRGKVKQALFAITGQNFSTAKEAKAWLKKNPLKKKPPKKKPPKNARRKPPRNGPRK